MKIALIDDESSVRETIRTILQHYYADLEISEAGGVVEGLQLISSFDPQLIFLDVEMGDGTGFDLLTRLQTLTCPVVFVTAHDHYAVKAFRFSALDYILKPVDPKEIASAVEKARMKVSDHQTKLEALIYNRKAPTFEKIVLSDNANIHLVGLEQIVTCQAVGNYTHFFLTGGRELVISKTLKYYDDLLQGSNFTRVHQSHLINLLHLDRYDKREGGQVVMKDGTILPVSSRKKDNLLEVLKNFKG